MAIEYTVEIRKTSNGTYAPIDSMGYYATPTQVKKVIEDLTFFVEHNTDEGVEKYNQKLFDDDWAEFEETQKNKKKTPVSGRYIYLMQCEEYYKIGIASDVERRRKELDMRPYKVNIIGYRWSDYASTVERRLHKQLEEYKVGGEWYSADLPINTLNALIDDIERGIK